MILKKKKEKEDRNYLFIPYLGNVMFECFLSQNNISTFLERSRRIYSLFRLLPAPSLKC